MSDDLARLLDLPAAAHLAAVGDELTLLTITHEHADKMTIERRRLGSSIGLHALLQLIGSHGLAETSQIQVSEVQAPQLPAPVEERPDEPFTCLRCDREFKNKHGLATHIAMKHTQQETAAPIPTTRRTTKRQEVAGIPCAACERTFKNQHALEVHQGRAHKQVAEPAATSVEPEPVPLPVLVAQNTPTSNIPVPLKPVTSGICDVCDTSLHFHERCGDCQALLGPEHEAGMMAEMLDERPLCGVCVGFRATAEQLGVAA
jgi:uncharacterized C2H2 Zn-finger protein